MDHIHKNGYIWKAYGADHITPNQLQQVIHRYLNTIFPDLNRVQIPVYKPIGGVYSYRAADPSSSTTIDVVVFEIVGKVAKTDL